MSRNSNYLVRDKFLQIWFNFYKYMEYFIIMNSIKNFVLEESNLYNIFIGDAF